MHLLVALFSTTEPATGRSDMPRAFLRMAGQSVIERQVEIAMAAGAERIVVVSQGLPRELVVVQHAVEAAGRKFHAIAGPRALGGLISTADDLLVFADGVVPDSEQVLALVAERRAVLSLPADPAVSQGFERIDRDRAWAGVLRTRGSDAAQLVDLPQDIDPVSALMRIAVQARRPVVDIPANLLADGNWMLVRSEEQAASAGRAVAMARIEKAGWFAPCYALADRLVLARVERLHDPRSAARWTRLSVVVLMASGLGLAAYGFGPWALGLLAGSAFLARVSEALSGVAGSGKGWFATRRRVLVPAVFDLALLAVFSLSLGPFALRQILFPSAMMLGLLRLASRGDHAWLRQLAQDRCLLLALLAVGWGLGVIQIAVQLTAVLLLLGMLVSAFPARLTRA